MSKPIQLRVGNTMVEVTPVPDDEVAKANRRIQKKVQPILAQIKKTRRAAIITASKIILKQNSRPFDREHLTGNMLPRIR